MKPINKSLAEVLLWALAAVLTSRVFDSVLAPFSFGVMAAPSVNEIVDWIALRLEPGRPKR